LRWSVFLPKVEGLPRNVEKLLRGDSLSLETQKHQLQNTYFMETSDYRPLGRTGVKVSPLCLGCMMFGTKTEAEDSYKIIDHAIDNGVNFLDTANVYGRGTSEEITGEALKRNGKREQIILATKVHGKMDNDDVNMMGNSRRHIVQQVEASLKRLRTDYIDLYQIHRPQSDIPLDETLGALDQLVRQGKVLYLGTSTYAAWQLMEALMIAKEFGWSRFICEQPPYNILDRRVERELLPYCRTWGVATIPWSPLAGGLLTGKYSRENPNPEGARYANAENNPNLKRRLTEAFWDGIEDLKNYAEKKGVPMAQFALAWCKARDGVTAPIIGPRTMEQLTDNLAAAEVEITQEDRDFVDSVVEPGTMISPFYNADHGPHQYRI
jgi:aryl-alcohol dehydrogenase-like predicted oxidoreductase